MRMNANTNIVCKSEKAELDLKITPTHNSKNHVYEIKGSDGSTVDIDDLVVFPTEKTTYTATATSETVDMILMKISRQGPTVSFRGSPTVSPTTPPRVASG